MKRKALSLLLSLALVLSLALPVTSAYADDSSNSGMEISKTATANDDGTYTITLEAYATGSKVISDITKDIPTDIILVIDQSGSMDFKMGEASFNSYGRQKNSTFYSHRNNGGDGNLWYRLDDGSYVSVSVTKTTKYTELSKTLVNYDTNWRGDLTTDCYYYYANNLYEKVGDSYKKVTLTRSGNWWNGYVYTYTFSDGTSVTSSGDSGTPNFGDHAPLYTPAEDDNDTVYTYTYTDASGNTQSITTSIGANTSFNTPVFYSRTVNGNRGEKRLDAIKTAATTFVNAVAAKAAGADGDINTTADNIDHRIAVVGYADTDWSYGYNTGVFIGNTLNRYGNAAAGVYSTALQDMSTTDGKNNVTASLNALQASGATRIDYGLTMANGILNANPVAQGETRNRVVIVFTDGSPTSSNGFEKDVANSAITTADAIKKLGATVYSIGVFSGADAHSTGAEPSGDLNDNSNQMAAACNWFMQRVSSNNGTPRTPSYYLSASDSASLNSIFQQISDQIESGGSSSTLTEESVVKDIISPQFTLPADVKIGDIKLETYACTGMNGSDYTWSKNADAMGATATIDGDQVSVTGFNFSENYVGTVTEKGSTTYRGHKLVISFKVQPKAGFLGGNDVFTNTSAGIYENGTAESPLLTFEKPTVNVPIKDVTVKAEDKNVYLKGEVTAKDLKENATVKVGDVELKLNETNYGLADWQTEYVDITVEITDKDGKTITADDLTGLTEDKDFTVTVTVSPKKETPSSTEGEAATAKSGDSTAKINVFKPVLTFKDSTAYYGETVDTEFDTNNKVSEVWKHNDTLSTAVTMLGEKPTLDITYTPDSSKIFNGKYGKQDVPVAATVKINGVDVNEFTTFEHQDCTGMTCTLPDGYHFWIHIKTCTLEVKKTGGAADESYVFVVKKDGQPYSEVTVWGNSTQTIVELPVGTYTIVENTGWSWRYTPSYSPNGVTLGADNPTGTITCNNTKDANQWLNGFSEVVRNIIKK